MHRSLSLHPQITLATLSLLVCAARAHPGHDEDPGQFSLVPQFFMAQFSAASAVASEVSISIEGDFRVIRANGLPDHPTGAFPNPGNPNHISTQHYLYRMPAHPVAAALLTPLRMQPFGIAINGVVFDPGANEWWNNDRNSGWQVEPMTSAFNLGLDQNNAHVQPNGAYHYHGIPVALLARLSGGKEKAVLLGWSADGYPIYGPWGPTAPADPASPLKKLKSSYRLKSGLRPSGPGGPYDGTYVQDWEYAAGSGDLDECNGRTGVTPEFPGGTYYYCLTESWPFIPRNYRGAPDDSFKRKGPPGGPRGFGRPGGPPGPPPGGFSPPASARNLGGPGILDGENVNLRENPQMPLLRFFLPFRSAVFLLLLAGLSCRDSSAADNKPVFLYSRYFNARGESRYLPDGTYSEVLHRLGDHFEVRAHDQQLNEDTLQDVAVVLIANPSDKAVGSNPAPPHCGPADVIELTRFVKNGGGLIVMGNQENHNLEVVDFNTLMNHFGLEFVSRYTDAKKLILPASVPIIGGLRWAYYTGNQIVLQAGHPAKPQPVVVNDLAQKPEKGSRDEPGLLLASATPGKGRVVAVTDSGWISNDALSGKGIGGVAIKEQDNWEIMLRLARWAAGE